MEEVTKILDEIKADIKKQVLENPQSSSMDVMSAAAFNGYTNRVKKISFSVLDTPNEIANALVDLKVYAYVGTHNVDSLLAIIERFNDILKIRAAKAKPTISNELLAKTALTKHIMTGVAKALTKNRIFIVHGHNYDVQQSLARAIEKIGLNPIILDEQANSGNTLIEKFEKNSDVGFAIVLLTDDDLGRSQKEKKLKKRARQNVILELGYFFAKLGRGKVMCLYTEGVELPSDINGLVYTPIDSAGNWKFRLIKELKAAGYTIDANKLA